MTNSSSVQYDLSREQWTKLVEANELLCAFQVDNDQMQQLRETKLAVFLSSDPVEVSQEGNSTTSSNNSAVDQEVNPDKKSPDEIKPSTKDTNVTPKSNNDPIVPIARSIRQGQSTLNALRDLADQQLSLSDRSLASAVQMRRRKAPAPSMQGFFGAMLSQ